MRQFCVEWAAVAIMMHDMPKIYWEGDTTAVQRPYATEIQC